MGESSANPTEMATTSTALTTVAPPLLDEPVTEPATVITLRPTKKETRKKVVWTEDTVDNEHMNKKKSKCCCIYEKPRKFGESDSEVSDDECEHCYGHVERRKHHQHTHHDGGATTVTEDPSVEAEPTATLTLHSPTQPNSGSEPPDGRDVPDKNGQ